jgi:hypothetical protein
MLRRIATGARATLLTATDFTIADGLFGRLETPLLRRTPRKIDQPISIVFETEQSRIAEIPLWIQEREFLTDPGYGSSSSAERFSSMDQCVMMLQNNRVGMI